MNMHGILRKIERAGMEPKTNKGGKPIAAALPGTALGIGLEIPLACHRIFAADNPKAKIGLPEILVGIFPGAGGTTRLSRKLGAMGASPLLLEGKLNDPKKAKMAGVVDEVVAPEELLDKAREWVLSGPNIVKPWDEKKEKIPGGAPYNPAGFMTYVGASAMVNGKTQGVYPAAKALLSAVYEGAQVDFDTAIRIECRWFTNVLMNPSSGGNDSSGTPVGYNRLYVASENEIQCNVWHRIDAGHIVRSMVAIGLERSERCNKRADAPAHAWRKDTGPRVSSDRGREAAATTRVVIYPCVTPWSIWKSSTITWFTSAPVWMNLQKRAVKYQR